MGDNHILDSDLLNRAGEWMGEKRGVDPHLTKLAMSPSDTMSSSSRANNGYSDFGGQSMLMKEFDTTFEESSLGSATNVDAEKQKGSSVKQKEKASTVKKE